MSTATIVDTNIINFASAAPSRAQTVRKCGNCRQPGHTKPHCRQCDFCPEIHTIAECQSHEYMKVFNHILLLAEYSYAYHGSPRFIVDRVRTFGDLSRVPQTRISGRRYKKSLGQFICAKLNVDRIDGDNASMRLAELLYQTVTNTPRSDIIARFTPVMYESINAELVRFYAVNITVSGDAITYNQAPYERDALVLPNTDAELQIRREAMNADMFNYTSRLVHTVRTDIRTTAGAAFETQFRAETLATIAERRQLVITRIERLQSQLAEMDASVSRNTIARTNWDERGRVSAQTETRNRQLLTVAQNDLRQFQTSAGLPVNVPPLHPRLVQPRVQYPNITTCYATPATQTAIAQCPICWDDDVPIDQYVTPTCAHPVCATCLTNYMTSLPTRQVPCCSMCRASFSRLTFYSHQRHTEFSVKFKSLSPQPIPPQMSNVNENSVIQDVSAAFSSLLRSET